MDTKQTFADVFFKIYDRKIMTGEITFFGTKMKKNDFTRLCVEPEYVIPDEEIEKLCETMLLNEEEQALFRSFKKKKTEEEQD